ncbi:MAG: hypothetical protein AAF353_01700 [Pseudomonadota bacterium]
MVTINALEVIPQLENEDHQHAFVLVGEKQQFGVHMTQYHCELHKYQIILKLTLPDKIHKELLKFKELFPQDAFVLCNAAKDPSIKGDLKREFCIPDLGSGMVTKFAANIFQGFRPLPPEVEDKDSHYFPWNLDYAKPILGEFEATVERVVLFRPFDHLQTLPDYATYFLFGDSQSGECHMTNLQTAMMVTNAFEPPVYGPDYDHAMSLAERPDWLGQDAMLEAGVLVTTPIVRLVDPETGEPSIPAEPPFAEGGKIDVLYRGIGPARTVVAGPTYSYCTAVSCSPRFFMKKPEYDNYLDSIPAVPQVFHFSIMPKRYWTPLED